jgi:glycosyltransferase involved in cell wall biosynthesis
MDPVVSVVVPTFGRPDLVPRAVASALAQTIHEVEVIVVVDGRDAATRTALEGFADARLIVLMPPRHLGNADARNFGVNRARARWVAFLDDDDEWMPAKLERQLAAAATAGSALPIVTARILARSEDGDRVWPRRGIRPGEDWSEYFFCRRTPFTGEGMVILSGLLVPRPLLSRVPFTSGLPRHVDPDWLLRAARIEGVALVLPPGDEPLLVWNIERGRTRITTVRDWETSLRWCRERRDLFTRRGYAAFVLHVVGSNAAAQGHVGAFFALLREAFASGRPAVVDLVSHVANFTVPPAWQRRLARWYAAMGAPGR